MPDTDQRIIISTYDEDSGSRASFAIVEENDGEVDLVLHPFTDDARTVTLDSSQAWMLARELARSAAVAEIE